MAGCASQLTAERDTWLLAYQAGEFDRALDIVSNSKLLKAPKNQLLYHLERAQIESRMGQYQAANQTLYEGMQHWDQLYTKLRDVVGKNALSDQIGDYWGAPYEHSYQFFLSAFNFRQLAQKNTDPNTIRPMLFSARAQVAAWDAYFRTQRNDDELKGLYFADYFQKYYGALIHEHLDTPSDQQIAKVLNQEAQWLFEIQAPSMRVFNADFEKYHQKLLKILEKSSDVASLAKLHALITSETKGERKLLPAYAESLSVIKKKSNKKSKHFMLFEGVIAPKEKEVIDLGLQAALQSGSGAQAALSILANGAFLIFASRVLGINSSSSSPHSTRNVYIDYRIAADVSQVLSMKFELPKVDYRPPTRQYQLKLIPLEGESKKLKVWEKKLSLLMPFGELAYQEVQRDQALRYTKTAVRYALKHVTAMAASFAIYESMKRSENQAAFAGPAALASYMSASYAISLSEKADTRYFSTMPNHLYVLEEEIPAGKYQALLHIEGEGVDHEKELGTIDLGSKSEFAWSI